MPYKHALVTGASQGLGAHIATRLAQEGWRVTGLGRRAADRSDAQGIDYVQADLSRQTDLDGLLDRIAGAPDLVIHNAVVYPAQGADGPDPAGLEDVFAVNAFAPYRLTQRLLEQQPPDRFCGVIVINSESMFHADHKSGVYAASKAALRVLTTALAEGCRSRNASVSTLLLGPLADLGKVTELRAVAAKRGIDEAAITRVFLRKSNPDLVIDALIDFDACFRSVQYLAGLGRTANGAVCRLDGGSAGSLI